jgi:hypothetical protein
MQMGRDEGMGKSIIAGRDTSPDFDFDEEIFDLV